MAQREKVSIFLDSNIFYNNWYMDGANFAYLSHFLNNEWHDFLVSDLVVAEVENKREQKLTNQFSVLKDAIHKTEELNGKRVCNEQISFTPTSYDLKETISEHVINAKFIEYATVDHEVVVDRAIKHVRPFTAKEKGYRDTVIWLSFLDYLEQNKIAGTVVFVTTNFSDFFVKNDKEIEFNSDLQKDIEAKRLECKIKPCISLASFVKENIERDKQVAAINELILNDDSVAELFEDYIDSEGSSFLDEVAIEKSENSFFQELVFSEAILGVRSVLFDIFEGVEDPEIIEIEQLADHDVYVRYSFNFRIVYVSADVPREQYIVRKNELSDWKEISSDGNFITVERPIRPYFEVSFIYSTDSGDLNSFEVDTVTVER